MAAHRNTPASAAWACSSPSHVDPDVLFALLDDGKRGVVTRVQAGPLFERAALPSPAVERIWTLADADGDGCLSKPEFQVAMQLATCVSDVSRTRPLA